MLPRAVHILLLELALSQLVIVMEVKGQQPVPRKLLPAWNLHAKVLPVGVSLALVSAPILHPPRGEQCLLMPCNLNTLSYTLVHVSTL